MKIKHNLKIQEDGLTIKGQILDTILEEGEERGDLKTYSSNNKKFTIYSDVFPELIGGELYVWGKEEDQDNDELQYKYLTKEEAKKIMEYINEFTVKETLEEETFELGEQIACSAESKEQAIKDLKFDELDYFYTGGVAKNGDFIVECSEGDTHSYEYIAKIPKEKKEKKEETIKLTSNDGQELEIERSKLESLGFTLK